MEQESRGDITKRDKSREFVEAFLESIDLIRHGVIGESVLLDLDSGESSSNIDLTNIDQAEVDLQTQFGSIYPDLFPEINQPPTQ